MELGLKGKKALVTGSSRGIGAAVARSLGAAGANVVVNYNKSPEKAEEVVRDIKNSGGEAFAFKADVTRKDEADALVSETIKRYGRIDVLVNNAAIPFPIGPFIDLDWEETEKKITGEFKAFFFTSQAAARDMVKRRSGKIIHISSGLSRYPSEGYFAHASAKAAMDGGAKVMAKELGPKGVTVNVVGPGLVATDATAGIPVEVFRMLSDLTPLKRVGAPNDIAGVVTFLCSSLSDFVNGQYIHVNGGIFMY